ncbi:MAG: enoyl-CoA hydratase [Paucimonas sp.]|nr:enoyl-CoA hydratase [Paucimonas sp.]
MNQPGAGYQTITVATAGAVASVTLNRPEVRNAFNETTIAEISAAFRKLGADPAIRVIVLAANGRAFCAGADLNWMKKMALYSRDENLADAGLLADMMRIIDLCPKPVVARVQGDVYAGGMGLVAACDIAVVADTAHFCLSEVKIGLIPATISPYVLRAMGATAARRYFLTAERIPAQQALQLGLAHEVVAADALDSTLDGIVQALLAASPEAIAAAKRLVRDVAGQAIDDALVADTVGRIADIRASADGREGVQSFLDKRKPRWLA